MISAPMATNSQTPIGRPLTALPAAAFAAALLVGAAPAAAACNDKATDLIANQATDVGNINVCNNADTLIVTYEAIYPWCLFKADLHVATSADDVPQTRGNPIAGLFDHGEEYDCAGTATFEILLQDIDTGGVETGDTAVLAAHAVVEHEDGREEGAWGDGPLRRARQLGHVLFLHHQGAAG